MGLAAVCWQQIMEKQAVEGRGPAPVGGCIETAGAVRQTGLTILEHLTESVGCVGFELLTTVTPDDVVWRNTRSHLICVNTFWSQ
jgi:hypothetical protein